MITILWHDPESDGYTDVFPEDWFIKRGSFKGRDHEVRGPISGEYRAKCDLEVGDSSADLLYERYPAFNEKNEMLLGTMRLQFKTRTRTDITQVLWKAKGAREFISMPATVKSEDQRVDHLEDLDLIMAPEGGKKLVAHLKRERSPRLVAEKKSAVLSDKGKLACEVCEFDFREKYREIGELFCEVHHRRPLSQSGPTETRLKDLAILCSNCHRMIHRTAPMVAIDVFKKRYLSSAPRPKKRKTLAATCGGYGSSEQTE